jgi:hypothetical protein
MVLLMRYRSVHGPVACIDFADQSSRGADIDGFKLLEIIGLEMDIPVISASLHLTTQPSCMRA